MNRKQINLLLAGLILILVCGLFPPRRYYNDARAAGRGFLLSSQLNRSVEPSGLPDNITEIVDNKGKVVGRATQPSYQTFPVEIDITRLLAEWGVIAAATGLGLVWLLRAKASHL